MPEKFTPKPVNNLEDVNITLEDLRKFLNNEVSKRTALEARVAELEKRRS